MTTAEPTKQFDLSDADFSATHFTTTGTKIDVFAWRGTQGIGHISGDPGNWTEYGRVLLHTVDPITGTEGILTLTNPDDANALSELVKRGDKVAYSRNEADDVIPGLRPAAPQPSAHDETIRNRPADHGTYAVDLSGLVKQENP
jgi:hypothetical protein